VASDSDVLLVGDAASVLGVTPQAVRLFERAGQLRAFRTVSGTRLFLRSDVEQLAAERREKRDE